MSIILYPCIGIQEKKGPNPETSDPVRTELYVIQYTVYSLQFSFIPHLALGFCRARLKKRLFWQAVKKPFLAVLARF